MDVTRGAHGRVRWPLHGLLQGSEWTQAIQTREDFFSKFGDRLPRGIREEHDELARSIHGGR